ncbi:YciI family protein [Streptomyces sp. NPDC093097]|uniref:YciI family protein n=1 Tax=Streptomyces sp. NPDC093097 TaxID=3366027 RepID=UPI0037FA9F6E
MSIRGGAVRQSCVAAAAATLDTDESEEPLMKYMLLIIGDSGTEPVAEGEGPDLFQQFQDYHKQVLDAGIMVDSNVLDSFETATSVRVDGGGRRLVTDGPFAETREYLGGYYLLDLPDLDAAIDWAARCPGARAGRIEIRPIQQLDLP